MSIQWLAKKLFIPKSDHCFQFKANEGYLVRLERKMKEKGIAILEKTETMLKFRCKDTQIGGWHIGAHKIEVIAIKSDENLYDITVRFLGVKNLGIVITIVLWVTVISKVIFQDYSNLVILIPLAIISPYLINWLTIFVAA
jgi:hypothetical protein